MTEQQKQIIEALADGVIYGFIMCNSYKLERSDIISVLLETIYQLYETIGESQCYEAQKKTAEALTGLWS